MSINKTNNIGRMRKLVVNYSHKEIEQCIESQIKTGFNICLQTIDGSDAVSILAKAGFMYSLISDGYSMNAAIRELGKRTHVLIRVKNER